MSDALWFVLVAAGVLLGQLWATVRKLQADVRHLQRQLDAGRERGFGKHDAPVAAFESAGRAKPAVAPSARRPRAMASPRAATAPAERLSLESFVGGRVLLGAGIVVVLLGLAFFLKFAFDREWVGPPMRIAMGATAGAAAIWLGDRARKRGLLTFGHALMGGGLGALYLSNYFAAVRYEFIDRPAAFVLVGGVTALGVGLAVWRQARWLAYLGFLGGYLAPALLGRSVDALGALGAWLGVLHVGVLVVLWARPWRGLDAMALVATWIYYVAWRAEWSHDDRIDAALLFLLAMAATLLLLALLPSLARRRRLLDSSLLVALMTGLLGFVAAQELLYPGRRLLLGAAVLVLSGTYFACARWIARRARETGMQDALILSVFGIASLAAAVPVLLRGLAIAPMWAAAGTATLFVGARRRLSAVEACGLLMIGFSIWDLLARRLPVHADAYTPFLNGRFMAYAAPCAALLLCARILNRAGRQAPGAGALFTLGVWAFTPLLANELWARHLLVPPADHGAAARQAAEALRACGLAAWVALLARVSPREHPFSLVPMLVPLVGAFTAGISLLVVAHRVDVVPLANPVFLSGLAVAAVTCYAATRQRGNAAIVLLYAALVYGLVLLAAEFVAHGELSDIGAGTREDLRFRAQLWISMSWAAYASALLGTGFLRRNVPLRWAGLGVFLITLAKLLIVDLAGLSQIYRIGSFLGLGLALVAASFLYQRRRATP